MRRDAIALPLPEDTDLTARVRQGTFGLRMTGGDGVEQPMIGVTRGREAEPEDVFGGEDRGCTAPTVTAAPLTFRGAVEVFGERGIPQRFDETIMLMDERFGEFNPVVMRQGRQEVVEKI